MSKLDRPMDPLDGAERVLLESLLLRVAAEHEQTAKPQADDDLVIARARRNVGELAGVYRTIAAKVAVR